MPYAYITFAQAKAELSQRLFETPGNTGQVFFDDTELGLYITEALQAFNAYANFYRQEFTFQAFPNLTWYDLTQVTNTLRFFSVEDGDLVNLIQYHLLEPTSGNFPLIWTGSKQFQLSDLDNAIEQFTNEVLSETGCTITQKFYPANVGRTFVDDTVLSIRRVCWFPVQPGPSSSAGPGLTLVFSLNFGGVPVVQSANSNLLLSADIWGQQSFEVGFVQQTPGIPLTYRRSTEPPISFDVDIQPGVPGTYEVLTVNGTTALMTTSPTTLPVPNDWTWVVKYGALSQLFGRGTASSDPLRQQYCDMRYKHGIATMKSAPAVLAARLNDIPVTVEPVTAADFYAANWQALLPGQPQNLWYAGLNLIALSPAPDLNGPYSVTTSVVANMPVPVNDTDQLQIGRDDLGPVLDEAEHIAQLKRGGKEFTDTFPLHENFLRHCTIYNSKLNALSLFLEWIDDRGQEDYRMNPMIQAGKNG